MKERIQAFLARVKALPVIRTAVATNERYGDDSGGLLTAAIAYYGFLSVFPLLLLALSVLGFVLAGRPELQQEWAAQVQTSIPGLGTILGDNLDSVVSSRTSAGIVGVIGLAWSGKRVVKASADSLGVIWGRPEPEGAIKENAWVLGVLGLLGTLALTTTGLGGLVGALEFGGAWEWPVRLGGLAVTFALDLALFLVAYRVLARGKGPSYRHLLPGAILAAGGWSVLKLFGSRLAARSVVNASAVYGTFAGTVGLLALLYLAARLFMYGAELNAVLHPVGLPKRDRTEEPLVGERRGDDGQGGDDVADRNGQDQSANGGRSTMQIVRAIADDTGTLVRKEVQLAKEEIVGGVTARLKGAAMMAAASVFALMALVFLGLTAAAGLDNVLATWLSALIVAAGFLVLAGILAGVGIAAMKKPKLVPEETVRTIKEDVEWTKELLKR